MKIIGLLWIFYYAVGGEPRMGLLNEEERFATKEECRAFAFAHHEKLARVLRDSLTKADTNPPIRIEFACGPHGQDA